MFFRHIYTAIRQYHYWILVSLLNIVSRYRQSFLGPLWISASIGIFIFTLGELYGRIWNLPSSDFVPYLAVGYILWHFMSGAISLGVTMFTSNKYYILQSKMALPAYSMKLIFEVFIIFLHNLVILVIVFAWYDIFPGIAGIFQFLIGVAIISVNMVWVMVLLGILGAAYRDVVELVSVFLRIGFLATPVIWKVGNEGRAAALGNYLLFNPFYHFFEITRNPLLGMPIHAINWYFVIGITIAGYMITWLIYDTTYKRIATWI